jgi:hypothetical protein
MKRCDKPEIKFVVKTKDHEEYVLNAVNDILAALDECAWAQVLPILGDEVYNVKGMAEMIKSAVEDHTTFDLVAEDDVKEREMTSKELYPREIIFFAKWPK